MGLLVILIRNSFIFVSVPAKWQFLINTQVSINSGSTFINFFTNFGYYGLEPPIPYYQGIYSHFIDENTIYFKGSYCYHADGITIMTLTCLIHGDDAFNITIPAKCDSNTVSTIAVSGPTFCGVIPTDLPTSQPTINKGYIFLSMLLHFIT